MRALFFFLAALFVFSSANADSSCDAKWLGRDFNEQHLRDDGVRVCDYQGVIGNEECKAAFGLFTEGPHGIWCQQFNGEKTVLKSLKRVGPNPKIGGLGSADQVKPFQPSDSIQKQP